MTELLQQLIAQLENLPIEQQDEIAARLVAELQDEKNVSEIGTSDRWTEEDRVDITDFSSQYADSIFK